MASVIVLLVLEGSFALFIKQSDWLLGREPECVGLNNVHDIAHFGMCMLIQQTNKFSNTLMFFSVFLSGYGYEIQTKPK